MEKSILESAEGNTNEDFSNLEKDSSLSRFSKRYSYEGRNKIADEIKELRFQYFKKQQGNPEIQDAISEQEKSIEVLQKEKEIIEKEIIELEENLEQQKAGIWNRISSIFRKNEIEQELEIYPEKKKLEAIKKDIEDRLKIIGELESVILDTSLLDAAKNTLTSFYKEQSDLKSKFESEENNRDIETISKEKGLIFLHGIPTKNRAMNNTSENNPALKTGGMSTEDKLSLLLGLEPTISASVLKDGQQNPETYYNFGVILGGGKVLSAYKEDSGTLAESLYSRRSKYDTETQDTSIQPNISDKLDEAVNTPVGSRSYGKYNEIVVEQPKVAGLYINLSQLDQNHDHIETEEIRQYAEEMGLPVYALKDGKIFPFDIQEYNQEVSAFETDKEQIQLETMIDSTRNFSSEEKLKFATAAVEKSPFRIDNKQEYKLYNVYKKGNFNIYTGREGYKKLQRDQEIHKQRIAAGIEDDGPGKSEDVIRTVRERLGSLLQQKADADSRNISEFLNNDIQREIFSLYGFAIEAKEVGDIEIFEKTKGVIGEFGSFDECSALIEKRDDGSGNFKALDIDVPIEIRNRMSELDNKNKEDNNLKQLI